jgi:tol-pal system protein YbgF
VDLVEQDLRDTQAHVVALEERAEALDKEVRELRSALALDNPEQRATPADLAARISSVETDLRVLFENQNEANRRLSAMSDKLDAVFRQVQALARAPQPAAVMATDSTLAPPITSALDSPEAAAAETEDVDPREQESAPPEVLGSQPSGQPLVDPEELYQAARADFGRGSYDLAESGFAEFLDLFPESELADNSLYWVGECRYARGDHPGAIEAFDAVVSRWPDADKTPDAAYKKGLALLELNKTAEGIVALQRVKETWPSTPAGRLARGKLQSLGLL